MKNIFKKSILFAASLALLVGVFSSSFNVLNAHAANCDYQFYSDNNFGEWYDPCADQCAAGGSGPAITTTKNVDYTGQPILNPAQLQMLTANEPIYQKAATASGVPWQVIATLHYRETGLKRVNPTNDQGLFQDVAKVNGPYPAGAVTDDEFLRQATWAGNFIKSKSSDPTLLASGDEAAIKDAFFGYNGRAPAYIKQAQSLGFTNAYDGSPYVMNKADAVRNPDINKTTWGQINADGGAIVYPANSDYGAFVVYASLVGIPASTCNSSFSGTLNEKIVQYAQAELALWKAGTLKPGNDYKKYTYDIAGDWCAWFVSYILKEAGHPVNSSAKPYWSYVDQFIKQGPSLGFIIHPKGDGYKPKPGDLGIYGNADHINIVVGYDSAGRMLTIGGNQGSIPFTTSKVSQNIGYGSSATTYVEVK